MKPKRPVLVFKGTKVKFYSTVSAAAKALDKSKTTLLQALDSPSGVVEVDRITGEITFIDDALYEVESVGFVFEDIERPGEIF